MKKIWAGLSAVAVGALTGAVFLGLIWACLTAATWGIRVHYDQASNGLWSLAVIAMAGGIFGAAVAFAFGLFSVVTAAIVTWEWIDP